MDVVKKNVLNIVCGVIVLICVVALFWPLGGMYDEDQAKLNSRQSVFNQIVSLDSAKRSWPVTGEKKELPGFPNPRLIEMGNGIAKQVTDQAKAMQAELKEVNTHELLLADILPDPKDRRFAFKQAFQEALQKLRARLKGGQPPTDQDIHEAANAAWFKSYETKILKVAGQEVNGQQIVDEWKKFAVTLQGTIRRQRASDITMYLEKDAVSVSRAMAESGSSGTGPRDNEIWYAQNMFWVEQDLVAAIEIIQGKSQNVTTSPIKRLFKMEVKDDQSQYLASAGEGRNITEPGKAFDVTPTGRISNSVYDVVGFGLVMDVDSSKVPTILTELQRNRLITIRNVDMVSVDSVALADEGYIYGDVPVVRLTIHGEELFLRSWTVPYMPTLVKTAIGASSDTSR